jgi:hypothetical protein
MQSCVRYLEGGTDAVRCGGNPGQFKVLHVHASTVEVLPRQARPPLQLPLGTKQKLRCQARSSTHPRFAFDFIHTAPKSLFNSPSAALLSSSAASWRSSRENHHPCKAHPPRCASSCPPPARLSSPRPAPRPSPFAGADGQSLISCSDEAASSKRTDQDIAPIYRIINVAELRENVLIFLLLKDLILVRRVCRVLCNHIDDSSFFQKELFLQRGMPTNHKQWVRRYNENYPEGKLCTIPDAVAAHSDVASFRAFLLEDGAAMPFNIDDPIPDADEYIYLGHRLPLPYAINPLLLGVVQLVERQQSLLDRLEMQANLARYPHGIFRHWAPNVRVLMTSHLTADTVPSLEASCRKMFLTQPPCSRIRISTMKWEPVLRNDKGVTYGELVDWAKEHGRINGFRILDGSVVTMDEMNAVDEDEEDENAESA